MRLMKSTVESSLLAAMLTTSTTVGAQGFGVEARSLAMGNVSVATADIATAALANPAMLAQQKMDSDFALLLPSVGVFLDDSDGLVDLIDQFQVDSDACIADGNPLSAPCTAATTSFNSLPGKFISPQVSGALALGIAGETFSFAVSARSDAQLVGGVDPTTVDTTPAGLQDPTRNLLVLLGVQTTEVGVSVAGNIELAGLKMSLGVTPKIVNIEGLSISRSAATTGTGVSDLVDEDQTIDMGSYTTLDAGLMVGVTENIKLGVVARNLLSEEKTDTSTGVPLTLQFDTQLRGGIAYNGDLVTIGVDMDLTENDSIIGAAGGKSRLFAVGAEFNAFDFVQLRVGTQKNIASGANSDALLTAGVGLWFGFHLDISAIAGDDTVGAFVQTGFRF